jgi:hypothetical protein
MGDMPTWGTWDFPEGKAPERVKVAPDGTWGEGWLGHTEYIRADLALPRPWSTTAELEALPVGSVVRDAHGSVATKVSVVGPYCWRACGFSEWLSVAAFESPGLVLFTPSAA